MKGGYLVLHGVGVILVQNPLLTGADSLLGESWWETKKEEGKGRRSPHQPEQKDTTKLEYIKLQLAPQKYYQYENH